MIAELQKKIDVIFSYVWIAIALNLMGLFSSTLSRAAAVFYVPLIAIGMIVSVWAIVTTHSRRGTGSSLFYWISYAVWIVILFAYEYKYLGLRSTYSGSIVHDPITSIYFSVITLTTLGYGDYVPVNTYCRLAASAEALWGYVLLGLFVATLTRKD